MNLIRTQHREREGNDCMVFEHIALMDNDGQYEIHTRTDYSSGGWGYGTTNYTVKPLKNINTERQAIEVFETIQEQTNG